MLNWRWQMLSRQIPGHGWPGSCPWQLQQQGAAAHSVFECQVALHGAGEAAAEV
jgi:hypothetical protein